jgi:hypothetical protein
VKKRWMKHLKKEFFKVFYIASFLFITIFFLLPYLVQTSTYFHEKSRIDALNKYNVRNYYHINLLETIPNFFNPSIAKLGLTEFDLEQYKKLDKYHKTEIAIAGTISDLRFLFLIGVYLSFVNIYVYYKIRIKKIII